MRIFILLFLFYSCEAVQGIIGAESNVDDSFNSSTNNDDNNSGSNNVTSLEDQVISFWQFSETGGTENRNDSRGSSTLIHGAGTLSSVSGQIGTGIQCSSMSGSSYFYVSSPSSNYDFRTTSDFSVAFWARLNGTTGSNQILVEFNYPTPFFRIQVNSSSTDLLINADNGMPLTVASAFSSIGDWYHFVLLVDRDAGITVYRNGSSIGGDSISTGSDFLSISDVYICGGRNGAGPALTNNFNGEMDSVGVWDRLLTTTEISALYNGNNNLD